MFQYGIENDEGLTADDILNGFNNTIMSDLTIATRDTTIRILNETISRARERRELWREPKSERTIPYLGAVSVRKYELDEIFIDSIGGGDEKMSSRRKAMYVPRMDGVLTGAGSISSENRRLAFYTDSNPPVILDVIDNSFCPESDVGINCAIVETRVCVFLDVGDEEEEVKDNLLEGFRNAFQSGIFQTAVSIDGDIF